MNPNNNQQQGFENNLPGYSYPPPPPTQFNPIQDAQPLGAVNMNTLQQQPVDTQAIPAYDHQQPPPSTAGYQPPMGDHKVPFTNDMKQPGGPSEFGKNSALPGYGAESSGTTPQQREQMQVQQQMDQAKAKKSSGGYPGVVGGTPSEFKGVTGYDAQGNPIIPAFIAERHRIEQSLGPTCQDGGYHDLRMHLTNSSILFAVLILPYCCGYRGKRECLCTKCKQKFPNIILPSH